jgi:hypothetical protein
VVFAALGDNAILKADLMNHLNVLAGNANLLNQMLPV